MNSLKIIIVGRPNVGKSTLFNRLIKKDSSIVDNFPGTTRDYKKAEINIGSYPCLLYDTAGIVSKVHGSLNIAVKSKTELLLNDSDIFLFITDAQDGLTASDIEFAAYLRKFDTKIFLICNKMETKEAKERLWDAFSLGMGAPLPISSAQNLGILDLTQSIKDYIYTIFPNLDSILSENRINNFEARKKSKTPFFEKKFPSNSLEKSKLIKLAIIGRPNVGKSTLLNCIIGEDRVITSPDSGTTTDPVAVTTNWLNDNFEIIDTAGIRRAGKVNKGLEEFSVLKAFEVIKFAEIVMVILDNDQALETQDLRLINHIYKEGRGLVIAVNKWDREKNKKEKLLILSNKISVSLPQFESLPIITISAIKNKGIEKLKINILGAYNNWIKRISTAKLNQWLLFKLQEHPPPIIRGRRIKLRYITQVKARPPTFIIFSSNKCQVSKSYERYLINGLRKDFKLYNVPIRLSIRTGNNPYG